MAKIEFYREKKFKKTEIGRIPKEWEVKKLGEVFKFLRGYSYRTSEITTANNTGYILLTINNFEKEGGFTQSKGLTYLLKKKNFPEKLIIHEKALFVANTDMSKGLIIGAPLLINPEKFKETLTYSMDLTRLIPKNVDISLDYIFYFLKNPRTRAKLKTYAQGTNVLHLNHNLFKNLFITLPPVEEQKAIAKILKDFDDLLEVIEEKIKTLQRIKKGLMEVYFTKGVFEHKEFKDTEIGRIPKEWEVKRLGEVCSIKTGSSDVKDAIKEGSYMFFDRSAVVKRSNKYLFDCEAIIVPGEGSKFIPKYFIGKFDLHQRAYALYNFTPIIHPPFLYYWIYSKFSQNYLKTRAVGFTVLSLRMSILKNLPIPLPSLEEQKAIAQRLKTIDNQVENLKNQKKTLKRIKNKFMDLLLTGKVRIRKIKEETKV